MADEACAAALIAAAAEAGGIRAVLCLSSSSLLEQAEAAGLAPVVEAFADRGYLTDGSLVPRGARGDLLDEDDAARQAVALATGGTVRGRSACMATRRAPVHLAARVAEVAAGSPERRRRSRERASRSPCGRPRGARLEVADPAAAARVAVLLRATFPQLVDVVPGHCTVLATWRGDEPAGLAATAAGALTDERANPPTAELSIHVTYDGPDLSFVAEHAGLTVDEAVSLHGARLYTVGFLGFAPGFAYLVGGDPRLQAPRRSEPRTRVPAGSPSPSAARTAASIRAKAPAAGS